MLPNIRINKKLLILLSILALIISIFIISIPYELDARTGKKSSYIEVHNDTLLAPGIFYNKLTVRNGNYRHKVHLIEADLNKTGNSISMLLAKNRAGELQKIHNMAIWHDSLNSESVIGMVNGSFWSAYSNFPIGPTLIDGELVRMRTHKQWSSCFFTKDNRALIDTFRIRAELRTTDGQIYKIDYVNRRRDSLGLVLYNKYAGDTIPYVNTHTIEKALKDVKFDSAFTDVTDTFFDTLQFRKEILRMERIASKEYSMPKLTLEYLSEPAVNKDIPCRVISIGTGIRLMPGKGCIISFGDDIPPDYYSYKGDTLTIRFTTNIHDTTIFYNSISATPRVLRRGRVSNEARMEGSRGRRFIYRKLPRTALGIDKTGKRLFLVGVESGSRKPRRYGASLTQLGQIMKKIGAYDAMNLDGGGSSAMLINGSNVLRSNPNTSRKISTGLAITRKELPLKNIFKGRKEGSGTTD